MIGMASVDVGRRREGGETGLVTCAFSWMRARA